MFAAVLIQDEWQQYCTHLREGLSLGGLGLPLRDPRDPSAPCAKHVKLFLLKKTNTKNTT